MGRRDKRDSRFGLVELGLPGVYNRTARRPGAVARRRGISVTDLAGLNRAPDDDARRRRRQLFGVMAATLAYCGVLLAWTIGTSPTVGDESYHYQRAVSYFEAPLPDPRTTCDSSYPPDGPLAMSYWDAYLWHLALAILWKMLDHPSFLAAQIYHLAYCFVLGVFTYLAGRRVYGHRGGLLAWALVLTVPMTILFSTVFYIEVPFLAATAVTVYMVCRASWLGFGLGLAAMFLMRAQSASVLAAPLVVAAWLALGANLRERLRRLAMAAGVWVAAMLPDMLWRWKHFGALLIARPPDNPLRMQLMAQLPPGEWSVPTSLFDPATSVQMLGLTGAFILVLALVLAVGALWHSGRQLLHASPGQGPAIPDLSAWAFALPLVTYVGAYAVFLRGLYDVRYLYPATLFAALLAGGCLACQTGLGRAGGRLAWKRAAAWLIALAMAGQFLTVPYVVRKRRLLPTPVREAFAWIREHTPPRARVLYLEYNLRTETGRPIVWTAAAPRYLFSVPERDQARLLYLLGVEYIAVHPTRLSDPPSPLAEPTAYPRAWVRSLARRPYLTLVYPPSGVAAEGEFLIYRIDADRLPHDWIADVTRIP